VNHVRRRLCGGKAHQCGEVMATITAHRRDCSHSGRGQNLQSAPHWAASARSVKTRSTRPSSTRQCEPCQTAGVRRQSPSRRRRNGKPRMHRPDCSHTGQGKNLQSARHWAASGRSVKTRSTRPTRTIQWEPCQAAAGWRDRDSGEEMEDLQSDRIGRPLRGE
jgi:hypothetical protein